MGGGGGGGGWGVEGAECEVVRVGGVSGLGMVGGMEWGWVWGAQGNFGGGQWVWL